MKFAPHARALAQVVPFVRRSPGVDTVRPAEPPTGAVGTKRLPGEGRHAGRARRPATTPVLFLHGWGVGPHSYAAPLGQLRALGLDVAAPAQPGFGRTPALEGSRCCFAGYAAWAAAYLEAVPVHGPVTVVGHSFGGGVAVQLAHDHPDKVAAVVLCNAVGGSTWHAEGDRQPADVSERPWWEWGRILGADLLVDATMMRVLPAVLGEAVPNLVSNPLAMWRVGEFVRRAHLLAELAEVSRRGVPVTVVWSDRDRLVPHAGFSALCRAAGVEGVVVQGNHSWLIAHPRRFADIVLRAMVEAGAVRPALSVAG
jgi:pimeloyl-ACP methyl ester carboxylesterase